MSTIYYMSLPTHHTFLIINVNRSFFVN